MDITTTGRLAARPRRHRDPAFLLATCLEPLEPRLFLSKTTHRVLEVGEPIGDSLLQGDMNLYSLQVTAGKRYVIELEPTAAILDYYFDVAWHLPGAAPDMQPSGVTRAFDGKWDLQFSATETRTHQIQVTGFRGYYLHLTEYADDISTAPSIAPGASFAGHLEPHQLQYIRFEAEKHEELVFDLDPDTALGRVMVNIASEDSMVLDRARSATPEFNPSFHWSAPDKGTYYILLTPTEPQLAGDYSFSLQSVPDSSTGQHDAVELKRGRAISGRLSDYDDGDWFLVDAKAGVTYRFAIREAANPFQITTPRLIDPSGAAHDITPSVHYASDCHRNYQWTARESGAHFLELIKDPGTTHARGYELLDLNPAPSRSAREFLVLDAPEDVHWFGLEAQPDVTYTFKTETRGSSDTLLAVFDPLSGQVLTYVPARIW